MDAAANPQAARSNDGGMIHLKGNNRASSGPRATRDARTISAPCKMASPSLLSGIEQQHCLSADGVLKAHTLSFVKIAAGAGVGQIVGLRDASQRLWSDMIDMERPAGDKFIAATVLAAMNSTFSDLATQLLREISHDRSGQ